MTDTTPSVPPIGTGPLELIGRELFLHDLAAYAAHRRWLADAPPGADVPPLDASAAPARRTVTLGATDAALLALFTERPNEDLPREKLRHVVPGETWSPEQLSVHVRSLRRHLPVGHGVCVEIVATRRGRYRFVVDEPASRLRIGRLELHPSAHWCWIAGRLVRLQPRTIPLLAALMDPPASRVMTDAALCATTGIARSSLASSLSSLRNALVGASSGHVDIVFDFGGHLLVVDEPRDRIKLGLLEFNRAAQWFWFDGQRVELSTVQAPVFALLVEHALTPVGRAVLQRAGRDETTTRDNLDRIVCDLRAILGSRCDHRLQIITRRAAYQLEARRISVGRLELCEAMHVARIDAVPLAVPAELVGLLAALMGQAVGATVRIAQLVMTGLGDWTTVTQHLDALDALLRDASHGAISIVRPDHDECRLIVATAGA